MDRASSTDDDVRERITRELRESEERLRAIFNSEPECVKLVDRAGCIQEMNAAGLAMLEADGIEQVRGICVADFVHPDDISAVQSLVARAANGERGVVTFRMRTLKGGERWAESHATPLRTGDGEIRSVVVITHDVTERRRAREERDLYAQAMRAMNVGLIIVEFEDTGAAPLLRVVAANDAALRIARLREDELIGWSIEDRFPSIAGTDVMARALDILRRGEATLFGDLPYADDRIPPSVFNVAFTPISDRALAITYQDVTEQRRLAEQLQQWQKMEAIGRLAGGVAHDFNNLLTVIIGYLQAGLSHASVTGELRVELEQAHAAADRAARLTRQLLAFSRRQVLQPRVVDVDAQLRDFQPTIERLTRQDVALTMALGAAGACIRVDPTQLEQVVMNLVMNACDAMPSGGQLTIRTQRAPDGPPDVGPAVRIAVTDTGTGMDESTQARVFEPFFTTKGDQGTGLGLSTVYGIAKQSGGAVTFATAPGKGSRFDVWLPLVADAPEPTEAPRIQRTGGRESVLVVEDQAALRRLMSVSLERAGYRVVSAANGEEALALVRSGRAFDVMVTDLVMPGMNGRQVADEVARLSPATRVVFVSGYFHDPTVTASFVHFLQKPFTPMALATKVREALDAADDRA
jgi:PAS domain S-box-containing protein